MTDRDFLINRLERDLLGPGVEDEILVSYPSDVYLTGVLFPQRSDIAAEEMDQLQAEGAVDADSNDVSRDEISLATVKRPSSAGLSFMVECDAEAPSLNIRFSAGQYVAVAVQAPDAVGTDSRENVGDVDNTGETNEEPRFQWERRQVEASFNSLSLADRPLDLDDKETGVAGLWLHVRSSRWGERWMVTVAMVNGNRIDSESWERALHEENCFFQTVLEVTCGGATRFHCRPLKASAVDEDTRMAALIYRNVHEYAVGHTCSAGWAEREDEVSSVFTSWLPRSTVPMMSSSGVVEFSALSEADSGPVLSARWLSENNGGRLIEGLRRLPELYRAWLGTERERMATLAPDLFDQARLHFERAEQVAERMVSAVDLMRLDQDVQLAFRMANRALMLQRCWTAPGETDLVWRPFQLGFILLSLTSTAVENHPDRNIADLLWFPTGGGKTEAYLGLIAFLLFLRRLKHGERGAGVACIMRYTLRLLTVQQFQRAAAMICACNALRNEPDTPQDFRGQLVFDAPFTLGLWVGGDTTPNTFERSRAALQQQADYGRPDQLKYCPKHAGRALVWQADPVRRETRCYCPEPDCEWGENMGGLPVWTVDEDVYRERPSLVIGTIDKFAQVARKQETASLFGLDVSVRQPDLIIQDELHLVSGPLGTLSGLYEVAIDQLCTRATVRPKIIASTATIRQASSQIRALFNRETCLFPPPVLDAENSGFAVVDMEAPGREYVGITTAGRSAKFTLQATAASLMQAVASEDISDTWRDRYWTLVTYFNSLRELGGALVLMQDDVTYSLADYAKRHGETRREVHEPLELTSRVSSSDIKEILDRLGLDFKKKGVCDVLLASNMISVGVDVPRLGLMVVNGQPKGIAEYIQATSRVGRQREGPGGLIVTVYNNAKARDRSHFETFRTWHTALYREVEATSVTPFAPRARDKALHAVLVMLARHTIEALRTQPSAVVGQEDFLENLIDLIAARAAKIDAEEVRNVESDLRLFMEKWVCSAGAYQRYWNDRGPMQSLLISAEKAAEERARRGAYRGRAEPTPNSMRNVEPGTMFRLRETL